MKPYNIYALFIILFIHAACLAQNNDGLPIHDRQTGENIQQDDSTTLNEYQALAGDPSEYALQKLELIHSNGMEKKPENFNMILKLLNLQKKNEQKIVLIRILSSFHSRENANKMNRVIETRLRDLAQSGDKNVATAALLSYSRLGYFSDTESLLEGQLRDGFISKDDVYGELAHVLHFAPAHDQIRLIEKIGNSKSEYAIDIIASNIKSAESRRLIPAATKRVLQTLLEQNEPTFSTAIGEFSLKEAIAFSDWLHVLASLTDENTRISYDEVIMNHLNGANYKPKKAISYFISAEGKTAIDRIGHAKLADIFWKISNFSKTLPYPQNKTVQGFVANIVRQAGAAKR